MIQKISSISSLVKMETDEGQVKVIILHEKHSVFLIMINSAIQKLEEKYNQEQVIFCSIEVSKQGMKSLLEAYYIKQIPSILFFKHGSLKHKIEGIVTRKEFETTLNELLSKTKKV